MNTRHASRWFWTVLAVVCLTIPFFANKSAANKAAARAQGGNATASAKTDGGLKVVTFTFNQGTIKVILPDDMRAGDKISATVSAKSNGQTPEERATNEAKLREHVVALTPVVDPKPPAPVPALVIFDLSKGVTQPGGSSIVTGTFTAPTKVNTGLFLMPNQNSPIGPCGRSGSIVAINESCSPISQLVFDLPSGQITVGPSGAVITPDPKITPPTTPSGAVITPDPKTTPPTHPPGPVITPDPKITPTFIIPPLGQAGTPIVITGPFDGNSSNTIVNFVPQFPAPQIHQPDLVYAREIARNTVVSGMIWAESPRKAVFNVPANVTGSIDVKLKEGDVETKGTYRNVGVNLTAPKTNLLKGEKTELKVEVTGLQGLKVPVPLILECKGVITMVGGIYQPLVIQPSQVGADGRYTTTRGITGVQTGGWEATATVVTTRFNVCLQDDTAPARRILWNTVTGEYIFTYPEWWPPKGKQGGGGGTTGESGGGKTGGGKTGGETGSTIEPADPNFPPTDPPTGLTGKGKMIMKGCIITLQHNAPDRRVFSRLDSCTTSGSSTVEDPKTKTKFTITDRNIADNTCQSQ